MIPAAENKGGNRIMSEKTKGKEETESENVEEEVKKTGESKEPRKSIKGDLEPSIIGKKRT